MVLRADGTVTTNSFISRIDRLLGNICCADRSWIFFFLVMDKLWKIDVVKDGAPWSLEGYLSCRYQWLGLRVESRFAVVVSALTAEPQLFLLRVCWIFEYVVCKCCVQVHFCAVLKSFCTRVAVGVAEIFLLAGLCVWNTLLCAVAFSVILPAHFSGVHGD